MKKALALVSSLLLPAVVLAQGTVSDATSLVSFIIDISNKVVQVLLVLAVVWVIWEAFKYLTNASNPEARSDAKNGIIYGVVLIAVMLSVWGLVNLVTGTFKLNNTAPTTIPTFQAR